MSTLLHCSRLVLALCLLSQLCGCGGNRRCGIDGSVTLDGQPVESGTITFLPIEETKGPTAGAIISGGRYTLASDKGPFAGVYRVEIHALRKTGKMIEVTSRRKGSSAEVEENEEAVPAEYNTQSTLRVEVHSGKNTHDFKLDSQPK